MVLFCHAGMNGRGLHSYSMMRVSASW